MTYSTVIRGLVGLAIALVAAGCDRVCYEYEPVAHSTQTVYTTETTAIVVDDGSAHEAVFVDTVSYPVVQTTYRPRVVITNTPLCRYGCVNICHHNNARGRTHHSGCPHGCAPDACRHRESHVARRVSACGYECSPGACRHPSRPIARRQPQHPNVHDGDRLISERKRLEAERKLALEKQRQAEAQQKRLVARRAELKRQQAVQQQAAKRRNQRKTVATRTPTRRTPPNRTQLADNMQRGR
jgi:hypothetical protein